MPFGSVAARRATLLLALSVLVAGTASPLSAAMPRQAVATGTGVAAADVEGPGTDALLRGSFTIDTDLRSPSGLSAWAIDRYLAANTPLPPLGTAFKAAELKHGVNARYLLAHAMLETAFGRSYFALNHRNLFGWNAFDRDPGKFASRFPTYAAGIDYVAGRIRDWYLVPGGRYYGGAPTLRGMHMYASDPKWEQGIARIANTMAIPTLAGRTFEISTPAITGTVFAGRKSTVSVTTSPTDGRGPLPDGLTVAARWRPISIVETSPPAKELPPALPDFALVAGETRGGSLRATVVAPAVPGRYRLELELRDSDGTPLTDGSRLTVPGFVTRVHAIDAVTYALAQTDEGLAITIANIGRKPIAAIGTGKAAAVLTAVAVWSIPRRGSPLLLTRIPLASDLEPGGRWSGVIPTEVLEGAIPGILLLRLEVAGSPKRLTTSPPGVFQVDPTGQPAATPAPSATPAPDPTPASTGPAPATAQPSIGSNPTPVPTAPAATGSAIPPSPSPGPTPSPLATPAVVTARAATTAAPTPSATTGAPAGTDAAEPFVLPPLKIRVVTPDDPGSAAALNIDARAKAAAKAKAAKAKATAKALKTSTTATTGASAKPVRAIRYETFAGPSDGRGFVLLTNTGTITYHRAASAGSTGTNGTSAPATALIVTAIPATAGLDAPIVLRFPLAADLAPGARVEVPIRLPALPGVQPAFLVSARLVTADSAEQPTSAATVFWMRGAPAAPKPVVVTKPVVPAKPAPPSQPANTTSTESSPGT